MVSIRFTQKLITAKQIIAEPLYTTEESADCRAAAEEGKKKKRVHLIFLLFVDKQDLGDMGESL